MAVPVRLELLTDLARLATRLGAATARYLAERRLQVEGLARGLPEPRRLLENAAQRLDDRSERLELAIQALLRDRRGRLDTAAARLKHPRDRIQDALRRLESPAARLRPALERTIERAADRVARLGQVLDSLSPWKVLERGYAVVEDRTGRPLPADEISAGLKLRLRFHAAVVDARAESGPHPPGEPATAPARSSPTERQPRLL
jgi:exodeoxyribonuclease VII large subunit